MATIPKKIKIRKKQLKRVIANTEAAAERCRRSYRISEQDLVSYLEGKARFFTHQLNDLMTLASAIRKPRKQAHKRTKTHGRRYD